MSKGSISKKKIPTPENGIRKKGKKKKFLCCSLKLHYGIGRTDILRKNRVSLHFVRKRLGPCIKLREIYFWGDMSRSEYTPSPPMPQNSHSRRL
jgi:hypothetical protein